MKVFIIHMRRTAYGVVRALADTDCEIYGADTARAEAGYSKYLRDFFVVPEITACSERQFLDLVIDLAKKMKFEEEKPVVFTGKDDYLQFFSKHYAELEKYYHLSFETDYAKLLKALDKLELSRVAVEQKVHAPRAYTIEEFDSRKDIAFPVIIKPAIKNRPDIDVVAQGFRVKFCNNEQELRDAVAILRKLDQPYIIQEFIPGDDSSLYTFGVYCFRGRLIAWSTGRKLRQFPPATGECSLGETVYVPELVEPSEKLIRAIGLSGIMQIEYKKAQGKYYLIEINPRIWSWHELNRMVGVNLVEICLNVVLNKKKYDTMVSPRNERRTWSFLGMDILHNVILNKNISMARALSDGLRADLEAFFNWRDLGPSRDYWKRTIPYIKGEIKKAKARKNAAR